MLLLLWLERLRERWFGKSAGRVRRHVLPAVRRQRSRRLRLEALEDRIVPAVVVQNEFAGLNFGQSGGWVPPDTQGAAGPTSYVETVNQAISIYSKSSGSTISSDSLPDFFFSKGGLAHLSSPDFQGDSFVTYDPLAKCFIAGDLEVALNSNGNEYDGAPNSLLLAVSKSDAPTTLTKSDWYFYELPTTESGISLQDYPGNIGYNAGAVVITQNSFSNSGFQHVLINTISINALTSGAALTEGTNYFQTDFSGYSLRPAAMQDSTSPNDPMWFVAEEGDDASISVIKMSNVLSSSPSFTTTNLAVNPYYGAVPELQPDGSPITKNTDSRIMNAAMQNGLLVAAHQVSDQAGDLDKVQWYVIDTNGNTPVLQQQGDISGGPGTYYAYPGIDINVGDEIGVSYIASGTGPGQYMSVYATGRLPTDAAGTMETPVLIQAGQGISYDTREGDMSGINVDPNDGTFWISNEYAGSAYWDTAVAHFTLGNGVHTTAANASAVYSVNTQAVALSAAIADITDPSNTVSQGTVTFTIEQGSTIVGSVSTGVSGGNAATSFTLPAALAAGSYTIAVSYTDSAGQFIDIGDTNGVLVVSPAQVSTTAASLSTSYSLIAQTFTLSATVSDDSFPGQIVNEGSVNFTVSNGGNVLFNGSANVVGGAASVGFTVPAQQPPGTYTIAVSYFDNQGNFIDNGDTNGTLTISTAKVSTTAASLSTTYSLIAQPLTLSATVSDDSFPGQVVNEGSVTFTVTNGKTILFNGSGNVVGGTAKALFTLPAGQVPGTYAINVSYFEKAGNFLDNGDTNATLTVVPANVTTSAANASATFSTHAQTVTLSAKVADSSFPGQTVNEGIVTFTVMNGGTKLGTVTGSVSAGAASAAFNLPAGQAAGSYIIDVSYNDPLGNFDDSGDTSASLTIAPANVTTTAANPPALVYNTNAQSITVSAAVADVTFANDTVNEGSVTFDLTKGGKVLSSAVGDVVSGTASTTLSVPAGLTPGSYTLAVRYSDSAGNFRDIGDNNASLSITHAGVATVAANASLDYSTQAQTVTLSAGVSDTNDPSDVVNEGVVTFTVAQGSTIVGNAQGTVSGGATSVTFAWSAGRAAGNYTIAVSYSDNTGNYTDVSDTSGTLAVSPAQVATTAVAPPTIIHSSNAQTVTVQANVADLTIPADTVNEGVVTFTLLNGKTVVGTPVQGTVRGGTASATYTLPAGLDANSYTLAVSYSDSLGNFTDTSDKSAVLIVSPAAVAVTANSAAAIYSPNTQSLTLTANVANLSVPSQAVGEGVVTFTIMNGTKEVGSVQGTVSSGSASAAFALPAGQAPGSYTIQVGYSDAQNNFIDTGDTNATLTVSPAKVATAANNVSASFSPNAQNLTLTANVTDSSIPTDTVGEGIVTFTIVHNGTALGSTQGTVSGGKASGIFNWPAGQAVGGYTIQVSYSDSTGNFVDTGDSFATLTIASANVSTTANPVSAVYSTNSQTLTLSAAVADTSIPGDTVGQGVVTFAITNGKTTLGSVQGAVSGGTASANFTLAAGQAAGNYTIAVRYSDSSVDFTDNGDTSAVLSVSPANVVTTANTSGAAYSTNTQIVKFSASVADASIPTDTVKEGSVTFTLKNGSTVVGSTQGIVAGGVANASLTLPAGLSPGSYTLAVSYTDSNGNFLDSGDINAPFAVTAASVNTSASANSSTALVYSQNAQSVTLNANITDSSVPSDIVNEGVVAFTILNGNVPIGSGEGNVNGGAASADVALPAGLPAGNYTIAVSYSDSKGYFSSGGINYSTLVVAPSNATTTAAAAGATYSVMPQTVTVHAAVADPGPASNVIDEGAVRFSVMNGNTVIGTGIGLVQGGTASTNVTLPGGLAAGNYTLAVGYSDSNGNFIDNGGNNATLTVGAAGTTTQLTGVSLAPTLLSLTATETLTAHVGSSTQVAQGTVTFYLSNRAVTANVDGNGNAVAVVSVPMLQLLGPQNISVNYSDAANNLGSSSDQETAAWRVFNPVLPTTATFTPSRNSVTADLFGLFITYTNGVLTEIDYGSIHLVFSYNALGQMEQVSFNGTDLT